MIELTLLTLLNYVGDNFCQYRNLGHDNYKSLLLSYSDASNKYGPLEVKKTLMIELTLLTLLNYVGNNFCEYRDLGHDNYKSLLLSYSDASNKFGPLEVKKVIEKSENFKVAAVAIAAIKCPQHIVN